MRMDVQAGPAHLRVQLTLVSTTRGSTADRRGPFHSALRVAGRNFDCEVVPQAEVTAGGHAVHCAIKFADAAAALPLFPPGTHFELWEGSRKGYGTVLSVLSGP